MSLQKNVPRRSSLRCERGDVHSCLRAGEAFGIEVGIVLSQNVRQAKAAVQLVQSRRAKSAVHRSRHRDVAAQSAQHREPRAEGKITPRRIQHAGRRSACAGNRRADRTGIEIVPVVEASGKNDRPIVPPDEIFPKPSENALPPSGCVVSCVRARGEKLFVARAHHFHQVHAGNQRLMFAEKMRPLSRASTTCSGTYWRSVSDSLFRLAATEENR